MMHTSNYLWYPSQTTSPTISQGDNMPSSKLHEVQRLSKVSPFDQKNCVDTASYTCTPPRTPTATTSSAHKLFSELQEIYNALSTLATLEPGEQVNHLLTHLVHLCIVPYSAEFTTNFFSIHGITELCDSLRPLCATAEGELEKHWASRMIHAARTISTYAFRLAQI
jgi:hypothetical protein